MLTKMSPLTLNGRKESEECHVELCRKENARSTPAPFKFRLTCEAGLANLSVLSESNAQILKVSSNENNDILYLRLAEILARNIKELQC
jgi:hypothetical protein